MDSPSKTRRRRQPGSGEQQEGEPIPPTSEGEDSTTEVERCSEECKEKKVKPVETGIKAKIKFIINDAKQAFGILCTGGQLGYFVVGAIYVKVSEMVLPPWLVTQTDNLFTPEGSLLRKFVSSVQLVIRLSVCASSILAGFVVLIFGSSIICALGFLYAYVNTPNGDIALLLSHRYQISTTFTAGTLIGLVLSFVYPPLIESGLYFSISGPFSIGVLLWKAHEEKVKAEKQKKKEEENKTLLGKVKNTLADTVVGEVSIDGNSSDIKLSDVVNAVTTDPVAKWKGESDSLYQLAARVCFGLSYGVILNLGWCYISQIVVPFVVSLVYGDRSFIMRYLFEGLRKSLETPEVVAI
eukprot:TRINITY_DN2213_c0_g1_i2.p1 TRINITY_DN2213_c0_g1~~TRINITY_DN2213_c0_g1_i2.p1  ORF type:complete len:353 (+),score=49.65 TRINITY_DN2213_c0_g1_i2:56-1114(+)